MEMNKKRKKLIVILALPVIMAGALFYTMSDGGDSPVLEPDSEIVSDRSVLSSSEEGREETDQALSIYVDVGGAVLEPQVVMLEEGARVFQAIEAAGGQRDDADLRNINLAAVCEDGQKIYVPSAGEEEEGTAAGTGTSAAASAGPAGGLVNINTAGSEELQTLSGVGPGIAQRIIDYRNSEGSFRSIEDLKNVSGIGDKTFEKLRDYICV